MCGICGFVEQQDRKANPATLQAMNDAIRHRGPDGEGSWIDGAAAIAMRRLAIIDLHTGDQPMFNEDGEIGLVFNGEIYNYLELRDELEKQGHRFKTRSDTETIVHLYEQHGPEGLSRLNGMFAIAIWDRRSKSLLLARDRVGKKPVYYSTHAGRLAFSSELQSLFQYPGLPQDIDPVALDNYFTFGYVPSPLSIYSAVRQLEPGSYLIWKNGSATVKRYWRLTAGTVQRRSPDEAAEELLPLIRDAVRIRLHSDVPFGAMLSGGVDSSIVVGLMSQLVAGRVKTFTIGFDDPTLDESAEGEAVARHFGTEHHTLRVEPMAVPELLEGVARHFGEPFGDDSAIPTYVVSKLARQHVTMALSGDGGDEVFGGYNSYRYHAAIDLYHGVPAPLRAAPLASLRLAGAERSAPGSISSRLYRFVREASLSAPLRWSNSRRIFSDDELTRLFRPGMSAAVAERRGFHLANAFDHFGGDKGAESMNHVDYETYLPDDILVKVDRMSMANSLEVRAPLLDYRLAEFAASLPREWKWTPRRSKIVLRKAVSGLLPAEVMQRRKRGFVLPISAWFRGSLGPYVRDLLSSNAAGDCIDARYCEELLDRHQLHGKGGFDRRVWLVACFLAWREAMGKALRQ